MFEKIKLNKPAVLTKVMKSVNNDGHQDITILYRDIDNNKGTCFVDRAQVPYYVLKDKTSEYASNPVPFIKKELVEEKFVYAKTLYDALAHETDTLGFLNSCNARDSEYEKGNLHKHPYIYSSDMPIEDFYISKFNELNEFSHKIKPKKGFYDIEVELMHYDGGFPDENEAPCPINIITYYDEEKMKFYSFITRDSRNNSLKEFEENIEASHDYLLKQMQKEYSEFKEKYLTEKDEDYHKQISDIEFIFCNNEVETITRFFEIIHDINPDFIMAWNLGFDIKTQINRLIKLLKDNPKFMNKTKNIICDPKYTRFNLGYEQREMKKDLYIRTKPFDKIEDRNDTFKITDGINWIDQMILYANIRKVGQKKDSYALDAIADEELGKGKLENVDLKTISYTDFLKFAEYNIRDVLLLALLERKNLDIDSHMALSRITNTNINKVNKKTISLKNYMNDFAKKNGLIMTNNKNAKYTTSSNWESYCSSYTQDEKLQELLELFEVKDSMGAFVANPLLNSHEGVTLFNDKKSKFLFQNACDQDLEAQYPNLIMAYNMDSSSQIGKYYFIDKNIKEDLIEKYGYPETIFNADTSEEDHLNAGNDVSMHFVDSLVSMDFIAIGEKFFKLPTSEQLINGIEDLIKKEEI